MIRSTEPFKGHRDQNWNNNNKIYPALLNTVFYTCCLVRLLLKNASFNMNTNHYLKVHTQRFYLYAKSPACDISH